MKVQTTLLSVFATIATLSSGSLIAHAAPGPIPWHVTEGEPAINTGKVDAFYVWHSGDEAYVQVTNTNPKGDTFTGTITVQDGVISEPQGLSLEKGDIITQVNPHTLTFTFHTYTHVDGLRFNLDRAASSVNMDLDMDGKNPLHVFAGVDRSDIAADQEADGYLHFVVRADDDKPFDWSLTAGEPNFKVGTQNAYYVWHDTKYVYIVCTGDAKMLQYFDGEVRLHTAPITDVTAMADNSTYRFLEPNILRWYFETADGEAGVRFEIAPSATYMGLTFHLDGLYTPHVYFGANMIQLPRNDDDSIVFNLSK